MQIFYFNQYFIGFVTSALVRKITLPFLFLLIFSLPANSQWVKRMGGTNAEYGQGVAADANGNVFVTGYFSGTVDFDPGPGIFNLSSGCPCDLSNPPNPDIFLAKYDVDGNFLWAIGIGGGEADMGKGVSLDESGNVYITGNFKTSADFDPGPALHTLTSTGGSDIFLAKYDTGGNLLWAKNFGGSANDTGDDIKVDMSGNSFVIGSFDGSADFDPGQGTVTYNSGGTTDPFFAKYDTAGDLVWAKDIEGTGSQNGHSIAVDPNGDIYITGTFFGTSDLDPGPGEFSLTGAGSMDPFFAKYTSTGELIWAKSLGAQADEEAVHIAVDASGNLYATGYFSGAVDFDPGAGIHLITSAAGGQFDGFLLKLSPDGNFQWAFSIGNIMNDAALSVAVDTHGNPYVSGFFQGTVDFDPGPAIQNITASGNEMFYVKYTPTGDFAWVQRGGGAGNEVAYAIATDALGNIYTTGYFTGTGGFETGAGVSIITSNGDADVFLLKFQPAAVLPVDLVSFTGKRVAKDVLLNWSIASQFNNHGFAIERLAQNDWLQIGFVTTPQKNSNSAEYEFTDTTATKNQIFYRLRQVDIDGHFKYSPVIKINALPNQGFVLEQNVPNPVKATTSISYSLAERSALTIILYDATGRTARVVERSLKEAGNYQVKIDCSDLRPGIYYYEMNWGKGKLSKKMMVIK